MTKFFSLRNSIAFWALSLALLSSCSKQSEDMTPVQPGETVTYKDLVYKFSFKAPKSWVAESQPGKKTSYYSSQAAIVRFQKFTEGEFGAKIEVGGEEHKTKEAALEEFKSIFEGVNFSNVENTTLGGEPALKIAFSQGADEDSYSGYRIFTDKDSLLTYFEASSFGEKRMAKYRPVFELAEKSVVPGHVIKIVGGKLDSASEAAMIEDMKPSDTYAAYNGNGFTIQYPNNFNVQGSNKGVVIKGERQDATIQVDLVAEGDGIELAKFADENAKKAYRGASVQNGTVGGAAAKIINYSFVSSAASRAYFVQAGKRVYRITINWPVALESSYKPAFEKAAQSFKAK